MTYRVRLRTGRSSMRKLAMKALLLAFKTYILPRVIPEASVSSQGGGECSIY